jgi:hypothetical protein
MKPDELWFKWSKTWEDIGRTHDVQAGERIRIRHLLCQRMGVTDMPEGRHTFGTVRHSYVIFSPAWVEAVQALAEGAPNPPRAVTENSPIYGADELVGAPREGLESPDSASCDVSPLTASTYE